VNKATESEEFIKARTSIPGVGMEHLNKAQALELQEAAYGTAYDILERLGQLAPGVSK
jgi:hypothetical protein